jgi:hypothetical protein
MKAPAAVYVYVCQKCGMPDDVSVTDFQLHTECRKCRPIGSVKCKPVKYVRAARLASAQTKVGRRG